jgi:hypothetical protein
MPINTDLNLAPYFDNYDIEDQFYRVMFKPGYAVQARELTQLQTMLQNQVEQFGDNIFKEGSIVKGCNFTNLDGLEFVKTTNSPANFNPEEYISRTEVENVLGLDVELDYVYQLTGGDSGLTATIVQANRGLESNPPNLNTFYIFYTNTVPSTKRFIAGESLSITLFKFKRGTTDQAFSPTNVTPAGDPGLSVTSLGDHVGPSFGIQSAPGVIFQKGHFLFASEQTLIVSKYDSNPTNVSVGYTVEESLVTVLQDSSLYDNANGSNNENAPGADRLKLVPSLTVLPTAEANEDPNFFALIRYQNGNAITLRDVSQYNVLGEELARRTYEESGNYILKDFPLQTDDRIPDGEVDSQVHVLVGTGVAYVKGYRVENTGERSFEIDQVQSTEVVNNQAVSLEYGNYVEIVSINGNIDLNHTTPVTLRDSGSNIIGSTFVHNMTPTRVYLFGTRLNAGKKFSDVATLGDGSGTITVGGGPVAAVIKKAEKRPLIFDTGMFSLFSADDSLIPVRVREAATQTGGVITINADPGEDFACENTDVLVIDSTSTYIPVSSVSTSLNNSVLTVNLTDPGGGIASNLTIYYNKRLIGSVNGVEAYNKNVVEPYVKVSYNASQTKYNLGFPDVFQIQSIVDGAGTDYTESFRLRPNQKDTYYDLSYMEYVQGRPQPPTGLLTIKLKVFEINSATGEYFFTINSYPNTLDKYDIPVYVSEAGARYNLRECFDFRPYVTKDSNVDYSDLTAGAAGTVTALVDATAPTFTATPLIPAVNQTITTDLEYYLSRVDSVVCDSYGELSLIRGEEQRFAVPPRVSSDQLAIAHITVPGFPALSTKQADAQRKREYAVKAKSTGIKNYTMKDLHTLEKKIDNMAYYISLNQLESETQNLTILDENGLTRFKNGFVVDPFNDLTLANIESAEFNAAIPFNQRILTPSVKTFPIDLKYKTSTSASIFPSTSDSKVATLGKDGTDVSLLSQPYASGFRNCVSNFYRYVGDGVISPPYDAAYDTTTNPVTIDIDLATPFQEFIDNLQEFLPLTDTTVTEEFIDGFIPNQFARRFGNFPGAGQNFLQTTTTRTLTVGESATTQQFVGDFISNFQFNPFMASRDIKIYMSGLRPNQRHWFFFDSVDVNAHIVPGTESDTVDSVQRSGDLGDSVSTDANGVLRAVFRIPAETFFVGDRVLEIADVDSYSDIDTASTSKGFVTYRAYNFSVERTSLTTSTRAPTFDVNATTTTRNVVRRPVGRDPIAQTFFIKKGMGSGSNSVFLSKVNVFFKRVSSSNGITLQIREVVNGYPSNQIIPFSSVHKLPSQLTSSATDDASVATTFTFDAPVRLDVEKEYAVVLQPDASDPNYLIFTSKVGGTDLTPGATQGLSIVQDWGDGVLFSSTNNSAWKSYQDEDMKFEVFRHNFNQSSGSVTLTHNDYEFLTVDDITGRFNPGELIYQEKALSGGTQYTVGVANGSTTLTGTALDDTYSVGDYIKVANSGGSAYDIFRVASIDSSTQLTLDKPSTFLVSNGTGTPVVVGYLSYYNLRNPFEMHLERSSAKSGRTFSTASDIIGFDSESTANTASIDNINLSYVQPMIMKANDSVSTTLLSGTFVPPATPGSPYTTSMKFNDNNNFNTQGAVIYSKSNDPAGTRAFDIKVDMANQSNVTSTPFVDIEVSKLLAYQYKITNTPATTSKYISKTIELAADLDAEDLHLIVTGYKPAGTDIKAYIRPQNAFDSDNFESLDWIELELFEGVGVFSSTSNINDYREFKYRVADADKDGGGALTYTSNAGDFSGFRRFAIRIDMLSPNVHNAPTLRDYRGIALT